MLERNTDGVPLIYPRWGTWLAAWAHPWLGIELVTFWFTGHRSNHRVTPARAVCGFIDGSHSDR